MRIRGASLACCLPLCAAAGGLYPVVDGDHCGYSDSTGKIVIAQQFQNCSDFSEGLAPIESGDRWGYVDETGKVAIPPQFPAADGFSEGLAFVTVNAQSKAVIDQKGQILFAADYDGHSKFSDGLARVEVPEAGRPFLKRSGYIDKSGAIAITPRFYQADDFHEGLAYVDRGFIDHTGAVVIPGSFLNATPFAQGVAAVAPDLNTWQYIDKHGTPLTQPIFDVANAIEEKRGLVKLNGL